MDRSLTRSRSGSIGEQKDKQCMVEQEKEKIGKERIQEAQRKEKKEQMEREKK